MENDDMETKEKIKIFLTRWHELEIPFLVERDFDYSLLESKSILSIVGVRRCGKTFLLYQIIKKISVPRQNIVYINFEDEILYPLNGDELSKLLEVYFELFDFDKKHKIYLLLDEIQNIPYWEKWVRRIYDTEKNVKIIITGSTSKLASSEISSALRGRTITFNLYPFSFKEFLSAKNFKFEQKSVVYGRQKPFLMKLFNEYLNCGGFPEVILEKQANKNMVLQEYYRAIFYRDVIERYSIRNIKLLENYLRLIMENAGKLISYSKIENFLKTLGFKVSKATLSEYMLYIAQCFLCFEVPIFSYKIKDQLQYSRKVYGIDTGLINAISFKFSRDIGRVYENACFLELIRCYKEGIYYWKDSRHQREVDFVIKEGLRPVQLIQVSYSIEEEKTKEREVMALLEAMKEFKLKHGLIITQEYEAEEKVNNKKIKFMPLWKWLLMKDVK